MATEWSCAPEAAGGVVTGVVGSPFVHVARNRPRAPRARSVSALMFLVLGAVLYAILAGRPLLHGDSMGRCVGTGAWGKVPGLPDAAGGVSAACAHLPDHTQGSGYRSAGSLPERARAQARRRRFLQGGIAFPIETFAAGECIVTEGEMADTAYVVVQGVCVAYNTRNGTRSNVRQLKTGSVFGEETVFHPGPCSATVEAVTDVSVRLVTRKMLDEGLGRDAWFGAFVVALADRLVRPDAPSVPVPQPGSEAARSAV